PASLERQTVRVHAQGGVAAVSVGGEAEQWHGSFLSLSGVFGSALATEPSPKGRSRSRSDEAEQVDGGGVPGDGPAPGGPVCPAAGAHRLPAVTAVPPGLCGVGLGGLRDGGGHVAEAGGPVGLPVPLGNVGPGGQVADALLHFGFPSLVSLVTTTLLVSRRPVNPARQSPGRRSGPPSSRRRRCTAWRPCDLRAFAGRSRRSRPGRGSGRSGTGRKRS